MSELKILAEKISPATISISESWLDSSVTDNEITLPGYGVLRNDRNRQGGGVCIFYKI